MQRSSTHGKTLVQEADLQTAYSDVPNAPAASLGLIPRLADTFRLAVRTVRRALHLPSEPR